MRNVIIVFIGLMLANKAFGTAQIPDRLIYKNDTIRLYSNPLESFYNENNPRPKDFGVNDCWSTACWRGYRATWEIKDNKLYLIEIANCCSMKNHLITDSVITYLNDKIQPNLLKKIKSLKGKEYIFYDFIAILKKELGEEEYKKNKEVLLGASLIPEQKANLNNLFGEHCKDGKVFAFWFSGDLTVPKGELVEYVHMGYGSIYEKELILTIEEGVLIDENEYENKTSEIDENFGIIIATSYSIIVPIGLIPLDEDGYIYTMNDTISFSNANKTSSIEAYTMFNTERKTNATKKILVEETIDSLSKDLSLHYKFSNKTTEKLKCGTACWIDGINNDNNERLRIFTMSNINSQVIIYYKEQEINKENFVKIADYIFYSVKLMEFGY